MDTLTIRLLWFAALMVRFILSFLVAPRYKPLLFVSCILAAGAYALLPGTTTLGRAGAPSVAVILGVLLVHKMRRRWPDTG